MYSGLLNRYLTPTRFTAPMPALFAISEKQGTQRSLCFRIQPKPVGEVLVDGAVVLCHLIERRVQVLTLHPEDRNGNRTVAASSGESLDLLGVVGQQVVVRLHVIGIHGLPRYTEQREQRGGGPPCSILARGAVEDRRQLRSIAQRLEKLAVGPSGARQGDEFAIAIREHGVELATPQCRRCLPGIVQQGLELRRRRGALVGQHIEMHVQYRRGHLIGLLLDFSGRAQIVVAPESGPFEFHSIIVRHRIEHVRSVDETALDGAAIGGLIAADVAQIVRRGEPQVNAEALTRREGGYAGRRARPASSDQERECHAARDGSHSSLLSLIVLTPWPLAAPCTRPGTCALPADRGASP